MIKLLLTFLLLISACGQALATSFTDLQFGRYQIADSQWDVGACMYTNTCNIYSTQPGTMYKIPWYNGQWAWQAGQYVKFNLTNDPINPYEAKVYNGDGSVAGVVGTGHIINMGVDSNGRSLFFFVGNDDNTGQLFSANYGLTGTGGYSWTGTLNPTTAQVDSFANSYGSTTPLAPGQTYTAAPPPPAVTVAITQQQQLQLNAARARQTYSNQINIDQIGSYNSIDVMQSGSYHLADINITNNSNAIGLDQLGIKNYAKILIDGSNNTTNVYQTNSGGVGVVGHFSATTITGNYNTTSTTQTGDGEKQSFILINGNNNNITNNQFGTGTKYSDIKATGNGHTVMLDQKDSGAHAARIEVTNAGGASNVNVTQQGNTNQTYLLQQSCANAGGCSVTMTQQ